MIKIADKHPDVLRLRAEWKLHGNIILEVNYDDTIHPWKRPASELKETIELIKDAQLVGAYVVITDTCNEDRHQEIRDYCRSIGIRVDAINSNPISLPWGGENKVYANHILNDRAGLEEAKAILDASIWWQRSYKRSLVHLDDIG